MAGKHIRTATKRAAESKFSRARMGAVIAQGSRVLTSATNCLRGYKTYHEKKWPNSLHCEQLAVFNLLHRGRQHELIGATIYVSRITHHGEPALAKPCPICAELIRAVGIKRVFYTTSEGTETYDV